MTGSLYRLTELFTRNARAEPRYTLLLTGKAITASGSLDVVIRDLSPSGAQIQGRVLPTLGKLLILRKGELEVSGRIAWREGNRAGIRFEQTLPEERLFALVDSARNRSNVVTIAA
jgi:hypothetical protein